MQVEQFVMAYQVEQDRLRAMLPAGFSSLRPVLRINGEIRDDSSGYLEYNTPVEKEGFRGWLNIAFWEDVPFARRGKSVIFNADFLEISFTAAGVLGGCPAEKDNDGCWFVDQLRLPEVIRTEKEYCDCQFRWKFTPEDARGISTGKTLPAYPTPPQIQYEKQTLTAKHAAAIPCNQVLGCYQVRFERG